ncbi:hypothetical protein FHP05_00015 [Cerasibacillus terrae]|uniref:Uncharacterized protein n=1 Tax=Cerasibacillus terrae TaxID=2498845 RepID=A0A5C8P1F8_9BACI|nr:hypothetical protein [Cerasibacillus terrae]TXL67449.1 hypothetical protein FHP05_00015 [Cerasibacillus terrae]
MRSVFQFIKENKIITIIEITSLVCIYIIYFILDDVPEYFQGGYELGVVISNLSIGYTVSYIFNILVVYIPEQRRKKKVYLYVSKLTNLIVMHGENLFNDMIKKANRKDLTFSNLKPNDIKDICKNINPNTLSPSINIGNLQGNTVANQVNWDRNLLIHINRTKEHTKEILKYVPIMDSEHIVLVNKVLYSELFKFASFIEGGLLSFNEDLIIISNHLIDYKSILREIDEYITKHPYMNKNEM